MRRWSRGRKIAALVIAVLAVAVLPQTLRLLAWRRAVVREAALPPGGLLLDAASGTGDIAAEALRQVAGLRAVGADFAVEMMRVGRRRASPEREQPQGLEAPLPPATGQCPWTGRWPWRTDRPATARTWYI